VTSELKQEALDTSVCAKLYPDSTVSVVRAEYLAAGAFFSEKIRIVEEMRKRSDFFRSFRERRKEDKFE
jgi:hypothetical protein